MFTVPTTSLSMYLNVLAPLGVNFKPRESYIFGSAPLRFGPKTIVHGIVPILVLTL